MRGVFQRNVFHIRPVLLAAAEAYQVLDEQGNPLLDVTSPSRMTRLVMAPILAMAVFFVVSLLLAMAAISVARQAGPELFDRLFLTGLMLGFVVGGIASFWLLLQLLGRKHFTISQSGSHGKCCLDLRSHSRAFGLSASYEVWDSQTGLLATVRTDHVQNFFFRQRWLGEHPDGALWFMAREKTVLPRALRRAARGVVGGLTLAGILVCLLLAMVTLIVVAPAGVPLFLYLAVLMPLAALWLFVSVAAFLLRKLMTDCVILRPDRETVLGQLKRQPSTEGPNILDLSADPDHTVDRRVAVALAVLLAEND